MAFSEKIINQVKLDAAFKCCRCQSIGIEVHHIVPQKDGGPDSDDNAAPLCPNCHTWFGDNPSKRKEIKQMRDWWYSKVLQLYGSSGTIFIQLEEINSKVEKLFASHEKGLDDLKISLRKFALESIDRMTADTARLTASGIVSPSISHPQSYEKVAGISEVCDSAGHQNFRNKIKCPKCGTIKYESSLLLKLAVGPTHYKCNTCGTEFEL